MADIDRDKEFEIENLKYEVSQEMGLPQKRTKKTIKNKG